MLLSAKGLQNVADIKKIRNEIGLSFPFYFSEEQMREAQLEDNGYLQALKLAALSACSLAVRDEDVCLIPD